METTAETTSTPQGASIVESARERGAQRREQITNSVSRFTKHLEGVRGAVGAAIDFGLGAPEVSAEVASDTLQRAVETKNRMVDRITGAKERLFGRFRTAKEDFKNKTAELGRKGAALGLNSFAVPIEATLESAYNVPAVIAEYKAQKADIQSLKAMRRARKISSREEETGVQTDEMFAGLAETKVMYDYSRNRADELDAKAAQLRKRNWEKFGKARRAVQSLQSVNT